MLTKIGILSGDCLCCNVPEVITCVLITILAPPDKIIDTGKSIRYDYLVTMQIHNGTDRKWQDYVYVQCEYKSTKQKIKHLLREENKVKENKIS